MKFRFEVKLLKFQKVLDWDNNKSGKGLDSETRLIRVKRYEYYVRTKIKIRKQTIYLSTKD